MASLLHRISIDATPEQLFEAVTTQAGLSSWWTEDVEAQADVGSVAVFGFGRRSVVIRMRIEVLAEARRVRWTCLGDPEEWEGTRLEFEMEPEGDGTTDLKFTHAGWRSTDGAFRQCNTDWGRLMYSLKDFVEGRSTEPLMR